MEDYTFQDINELEAHSARMWNSVKNGNIIDNSELICGIEGFNKFWRNNIHCRYDYMLYGTFISKKHCYEIQNMRLNTIGGDGRFFIRDNTEIDVKFQNHIIAGGSFVSYFKNHSIPTGPPRAPISKTDIDIFTLSEESFENIKSEVEKNAVIKMETPNAISYYRYETSKPIQLIKMKVGSIATLLYGFDIGVSQIALYNGQLYFTACK